MLGDPTRKIDMDATVGARGGNSYRALARNPQIVTPVVSGSELTLIAVAPGVTTVSISASNRWGAAFLTFRVTVRSQ